MNNKNHKPLIYLGNKVKINSNLNYSTDQNIVSNRVNKTDEGSTKNRHSSNSSRLKNIVNYKMEKKRKPKGAFIPILSSKFNDDQLIRISKISNLKPRIMPTESSRLNYTSLQTNKVAKNLLYWNQLYDYYGERK